MVPLESNQPLMILVDIVEFLLFSTLKINIFAQKLNFVSNKTEQKVQKRGKCHIFVAM